MAKETKTRETVKTEVDVAQEAPPPKLPALAEAAASPPADLVPHTAGPRPLPTTGFANLATAISAVSSEIGEERVVKRGRNAFHHYKYARMEDILQALTPLMSKHGIVIMQSEVERGMMDNGAAVFATYDFTIIHKSGEVWPERLRQTGVSNSRANNGKFDDKAINKCHTAARKYMLLGLFQIPTEDEADADRGENDTGARHTASRARTPPREREQVETLPPPEKLAPVRLSTDKRSFSDWASEYVTQLGMVDNLQDLHAWKEMNSEALTTLQSNEKGLALAARIEAITNEIELELGAREGA